MEFPKVLKNLGFKIDLTEDTTIYLSGSFNLTQAVISPYCKFSLQDLLDQKIQKVFIGFCFGLAVKDSFSKQDLNQSSALVKNSRFYNDIFPRKGESTSLLTNHNEGALAQKILGLFKAKFEWNVVDFQLTGSQVEFAALPQYVLGCQSLKEPFSSSYVRVQTPLIIQVPSTPFSSANNARMNHQHIPVGASINIKPGNLLNSTFDVDFFQQIENDFVKLGSLQSKVFDPKDLSLQLYLAEIFPALEKYNPSLQIKIRNLKDLRLDSSVCMGDVGSLTASFSSAKILQNVEDVLKTYQQAKDKNRLKKNLRLFLNLVEDLKSLPPINSDSLKKLLELDSVFDELLSHSSEDKNKNLEKFLHFIENNGVEIFSLIKSHKQNVKILNLLALMDQSIQESCQLYFLKHRQISQEDEQLKKETQEASKRFKEVYDSYQEDGKYILKGKSLTYLEIVEQTLFSIAHT